MNTRDPKETPHTSFSLEIKFLIILLRENVRNFHKIKEKIIEKKFFFDESMYEVFPASFVYRKLVSAMKSDNSIVTYKAFKKSVAPFLIYVLSKMC